MRLPSNPYYILCDINPFYLIKDISKGHGCQLRHRRKWYHDWISAPNQSLAQPTQPAPSPVHNARTTQRTAHQVTLSSDWVNKIKLTSYWFTSPSPASPEGSQRPEQGTLTRATHATCYTWVTSRILTSYWFTAPNQRPARARPGRPGQPGQPGQPSQHPAQRPAPAPSARARTTKRTRPASTQRLRVIGWTK